MRRFKIRKDGFFMGKHYTAGTEILLHEKQAKYAVMAGQLEAIDPPPAMKAAKKEEGPVLPQQPSNYQLPRGAGKPKRDEQGEFSQGRKVGGTFGGQSRKG